MSSFAFALFIAMNVNVNLHWLAGRTAPPVQPAQCSLVTVGYRLHGTPGQQFHYAGDLYEIPPEGTIELIPASGAGTYEINDRHLPLEVWPRDVFGFRDVPMPRRR